MRITSIVKGTFTLVGFVMLIGALLFYLNTRSFLADAVSAEGIVIENIRSVSDDSSTFKPFIRFTTMSGQRMEFISSVGTSPPRYDIGEKVEVLYDPASPNHAKINSFISVWLGVVIFAIFGAVFFFIGLGIIFVGMLRNRKNDYLKLTGTPIQTDFQGVERNESLSVNGKNPFQILTHWLNPTTSELHVFRSENIWFNPTEYVKQEQITVMIETGNPKKYYMDISFLPKLAK